MSAFSFLKACGYVIVPVSGGISHSFLVGRAQWECPLEDVERKIPYFLFRYFSQALGSVHCASKAFLIWTLMSGFVLEVLDTISMTGFIG